jgi:hypothetical protein
VEFFEETGCEIMNEYLRTFKGRHKSKNGIFRNECGGCGKPLRRNSKNKIGFLCSKCRPRRHENDGSICEHCPFEMECTMRVQLGIWIRCETPDIADLERLKFMGGLDDERIRAELEKALDGSGDRKVLEKTISQGAPKAYKSYLEGR